MAVSEIGPADYNRLIYRVFGFGAAALERLFGAAHKKVLDLGGSRPYNWFCAVQHRSVR
ncbi:MAG TPA: hypothetical protein VFO33_00460 [Casimicrobiaceae bacterium]|nr:hypothetical protein [Casimicrobiaceae bacterium]